MVQVAIEEIVVSRRFLATYVACMNFEGKGGLLIKKKLIVCFSIVCYAWFGQTPWSCEVFAKQKTFITAVERNLPPFSFQNDSNELQFIFWLTMILTAGAIVLFIIYIWNQKLKKAVHAQTQKLRLLNGNLEKQRQKLANS
ncbi:hypothetical protein [Peribacillus muralis]|uniref:hypothetical protein n=1 Tax=Peribacillus muralis TaxID=264697 RepID=UPI00070F3EB7|nr:hypothetical protein [Peribacillus muralis]